MSADFYLPSLEENAIFSPRLSADLQATDFPPCTLLPLSPSPLSCHCSPHGLDKDVAGQVLLGHFILYILYLC